MVNLSHCCSLPVRPDPAERDPDGARAAAGGQDGDLLDQLRQVWQPLALHHRGPAALASLLGEEGTVWHIFARGGEGRLMYSVYGVRPQSTELIRGSPDLVQHFRS